jgi:hypothetical protein
MLAREQVAQIWRITHHLSMQERSVFMLRFVEELDLGRSGSAWG